MKPIVILGVFVADLTFRNDRMPVIGQTLIGKSFKLGPGGIREVEFVAQSFQLIKGGRIPELQASSILLTLDQLNQQGLVDDHDYHTLMDSYLFLRKVENTL